MQLIKIISKLKFRVLTLASFKLVTKIGSDNNILYSRNVKKGILASDRCYANLNHTSKVLKLYKKLVRRFLKKFHNWKKRHFKSSP